MKIISFCNNNAGTGKTTTAFNIAIKFSAKGLKTLAIDTDPKFDLTNMFENKNSQAVQDYELLDKNTKFEPTTINDNLDTIRVITGKRGYGRYKALKDYLLTLNDKYDVIIIDTAPSFHEYLPSVLFASDIYVVAKDDWRETIGIKSVIDFARDLNKKISGIILTEKTSKEPSFEAFEKLLDEYQLKTTIKKEGENEKDYNDLTEEIMRKEGLKWKKS